jgi:hypothetical protein
MPQHHSSTVSTFTANQIKRCKRPDGVIGVVIGVHTDNPTLTFEIATCPPDQVLTGSGSGATSLPTAGEFNDRERDNGAVFSATNPFDGAYGDQTDILIRCGAVAGKINIEEIKD